VPCQPTGKPENRLYLGNMDPGMTEGHVLKLMRGFGKLTRCDYLWHVTGPKRGQPRGYCFVEYDTREEAEKARLKTNGMRLFGRSLVCHFAEEKVQVKNDAPVEALRSRLAGEGSSKEGDAAGESAGRCALPPPAVLPRACMLCFSQLAERGLTCLLLRSIGEADQASFVQCGAQGQGIC
jgi:RNA recognition motif-containing protein